MLSREERKELLLSIEENQLLDDLFDHPGMKIFLAQAKTMKDEADNLNGVNSLEDLHYKRGQIKMLDWFLSWQGMVKTTLVGLVEQAEREAELHKRYGSPESLIDDVEGGY
jgi:hypothetical protein